MPEVRLVEQDQTARAGAFWRSEELRRAQEEARRMLLLARAQGKDLALQLLPGEEQGTVKARYRAAARRTNCTVRFRSVHQRRYRDHTGREILEGTVVFVIVS